MKLQHQSQFTSRLKGRFEAEISDQIYKLNVRVEAELYDQLWHQLKDQFWGPLKTQFYYQLLDQPKQ